MQTVPFPIIFQPKNTTTYLTNFQRI